MKDVTAASFQYCRTAKELWDSTSAAYAHKKKDARIYQLTRDMGQCQKGDLSR